MTKLRRGAVGEVEKWLARPRPKPDADLHLVCLPYAGGGASSFREWPDLLPDWLEIIVVQYPGHGARIAETPFSRLEALIEALEPALTPHQKGTYAYFGHSLGALIAYELTHSAQEAGHPAAHLFVSGSAAPHLPNQEAHIHALPDEEFIAELRRLKGTPEEVLAHAELMELMLPPLRADFALYELYAYSEKAKLDCPITSFGGASDPRTSRAQLGAWEKHTQADFEYKVYPGDHFFLHTAREQLLDHITKSLDQYRIREK